MEHICFKGRMLPPIFSLMHLHDNIVVGYADNIIGNERWWISDKRGDIAPFAVRVISGNEVVITVAVHNNTCEILANENPEVYSDKQREYIKQTFSFFAGK
jgi:hypothetical protein